MCPVHRDRFVDVASPQLWHQLTVATRAINANTSDCFKLALKTLLLQ